jgi:hypothetical protein
VSAASATARPFVTQLRTPRGQVHSVGAPGGERIVVRVQYEALWDAIAIDVRSDETVEGAVTAMLANFHEHAALSAFVVKVRGHEVSDLAATLADAGVRSGTTIHVAHRFRRPIR